jgi:hypothetical protein
MNKNFEMNQTRFESGMKKLVHVYQLGLNEIGTVASAL